MKLQKLELKDISAGDKIIAISKNGNTRAIIIIREVWAKHVDVVTTEINCYEMWDISKYDFYICPQALTLEPNLTDGCHALIGIGLLHESENQNLYIYKDGVELDYDAYNPDNIKTIPDTIPYTVPVKEMTIAQISKELGYEIKVIKE